jgi:hypothetical protein
MDASPSPAESNANPAAAAAAPESEPASGIAARKVNPPLLRPPAPEPLRKGDYRPPRNGICWCGSGKKYKKCHLPYDEGRTR